MQYTAKQQKQWKKRLATTVMLVGALVGTGASVLQSSVPVLVTPVAVKPDDTKMANNSLVFSTDAKYKKAFQSATSSNKAIKTLKQKDGKTLLYWDHLTDLKANDTITLSYGAVGCYKGKEIKVDFVLSGFTTKENFWQETNLQNGKINYIQINHDLPSGFTTSGISNVKSVQMKLRYVEKNEPVDLGDDSYISFNSLNGSQAVNQRGHKLDHREFVSYEKMTFLPYYITEKSGVEEYKNPVTNEGAVIGGVNKPATNNFFKDELGASDFKNGSVSFQVKGKDPIFSMGSTAGTQWIAFSSATLFSVNPDKPVKTGDDGKGKDIHNQEVNVGDTIVYHVKQKVNTLGVDLLEKYKKFQLIDHLPQEVDFVSAKVLNQDGKSFDGNGEVVYDQKTHTVTYTANQETLQKKIKYAGETYDLVVETKVNNQAVEETDFNNTAQTIVNKDAQDTNTIIDHVPADPVPTKKILDGEGKEQDVSQVKKGDAVQFVVKGLAPKRSAGQRFMIEDDCEDVIDPQSKSLKVELADAEDQPNNWKDVTSEGKIAFDDKTKKISWTVEDGTFLAGKHYRVTFNGTMNKDADYADYVDDSGNIKVPNVAHQVVGDTDKPTNEVDVIVPQEKPQILPPTGVKQDHTGALIGVAIAGGLSVISLAGVLVVKGRNHHEDTDK